MTAAFSAIDFEDYHTRELPQRLAAGHGVAAAAGVRDLPSIAIAISGTDCAWTYRPSNDDVAIEAGDANATTVVSMSREDFEGLVNDLESPAALLYHDCVEKLRGDLMDFVRWEAGLRALYTGRPVYDPDALDLRDRHGDPLDATRAFRLDDDPEDMAHFLREVGYLFVKKAFSDAEVATLTSAAAELRTAAQRGDQKSWWAKNEAGEEILTRVISAASHPALTDLPRDPRLLSLIDLADEKLVPKSDGNEIDSVAVLWKHPSMTEGLSDLPWHRDCGMGGHASMCPTVVGSVFLSANTPEAGALRFLPASWKASYRFADASEQNAHEGVVIPADTGDLTIHYGDSWHAAPPPTANHGPFRTCVLVSYERAGAFNHRGERHYNDVLLGDEEGQVKNMTTVASEF